MSFARVLAALIALHIGIAAANAEPALSCRAPQKAGQVAELIFGRNIGAHLGVTEARWARFLDREVTPRFPDGLSVFDVKGQWRDPKRNIIIREPSKVLMIVLPGHDDDAPRLQAVIDAYKARFKQQSVGLIIREACVAF